MSDYTVLEQATQSNRATVVIEYAVPGGNNTAGLAWSTVVAETRSARGETGTTVNPRKTADAAHLAALDAGTIVEVVTSFEYNAYLSDAAKAAALDGFVAGRIAEYVNEFAARFRFYGTVRTV